MARIRTIKPEFFRHRDLYMAERESALPLRVAFAGLWTCADRQGRFRWQPEELKLDCLPYDEVDFASVLEALAARGFIHRYAADGKSYGVIPSFRLHQLINPREAVSKLPEPPKDMELATRASRVPDASASCTEMHVHARGEGKGKGKEGKGREKESASPTRPVDNSTTHKVNGAWWKTHAGIDAKGQELGIPPRRGEEYPEYTSRLFEHLNATKRSSKFADSDAQ